MRRHGTQVRVVLGICLLCFAVTAFADEGDTEKGKHHGAPEIDVGSAAGALTIVAGALTLLGERLRRS